MKNTFWHFSLHFSPFIVIIDLCKSREKHLCHLSNTVGFVIVGNEKINGPGESLVPYYPRWVFNKLSAISWRRWPFMAFGTLVKLPRQDCSWLHFLGIFIFFLLPYPKSRLLNPCLIIYLLLSRIPNMAKVHISPVHSLLVSEIIRIYEFIERSISRGLGMFSPSDLS